MKLYFLTYGDRNFYLSKKQLIYKAESTYLFDKCISLGPSDLNRDFKDEFYSILSQKKGGGYWIWKFKILQNLLNEISYEDIVVYCDAGATFNINKKSLNRLKEYIEILRYSKFGNLRMECEKQFLEKQYTTKELFNYFNIKSDSDIMNSPQLQAGHLFFKKNKHSEDYLKTYEKCLKFDTNFITDAYNKNQEIYFKTNRHDQSIFSLISKIYGGEIIDNETEFRNRKELQYDYPFLSVRRYNHGPKDYLNYFLRRKKFLSKDYYF